MDRDELIGYLRQLKACNEAMSWISKTEGTPEELWKKCEDARWLLWLAGCVEVDRKTIALIACEIARTVLHLISESENRPRIAIETAEKWCRDEASIDEVRSAADAANAAADAAAYAADAADAARSASLKRSAEIVRKHISWATIENSLKKLFGKLDV